MVSSGPPLCWWLLMVVNGLTRLNLGKQIDSSYRQPERQRHTPWPHKSTHLKILPLFFIGYWKNSLPHIFSIYTNIFVGVEEKFQWIFWRRSSSFCLWNPPAVVYSSHITLRNKWRKFHRLHIWYCVDRIILTPRICYSSSSSSSPLLPFVTKRGG